LQHGSAKDQGLNASKVCFMKFIIVNDLIFICPSWGTY